MPNSIRLALAGGKPVRTRPFPQWPIFGQEERKRLLTVFDSGKWWYGAQVREFERQYAEFQGARYGVSCMNGTVALEMALLACGIGAGDEVIVPPYTFMATASAVLKVNAIPVFADIDLDTCNLDPRDAARKITRRTKAMLPVHFGGLPVDMDAFKALARKRRIRIIEDACHSWGSQWKGKGTGAIGDCGVFSFQMGKNITAGEGGILLSDNEDLAERARSFSNCGRSKGKAFYEHFLLGSNLRMTELQAAILLGQLTRLEEQTLKREQNAACLTRELAGAPGIALLTRDRRVTRRSHHMFIFRFLPEAWGGVTREQFLQALKTEGIPCGAGYPTPLYRNPLFQQKGKGPAFCPRSCPYYKGDMDYRTVVCPNAETICRTACWIFHSTLLASERDMRDIARAIAKLWDLRRDLARV